MLKEILYNLLGEKTPYPKVTHAFINTAGIGPECIETEAVNTGQKLAIFVVDAQVKDAVKKACTDEHNRLIKAGEWR